MTALPLAQHHCTALPPGTPPLNEEAAGLLLQQLNHGWTIKVGPILNKRFDLPDFARALALTQTIGALAESENHHPEICLAWGKVEVRLRTHSVGGLSLNDFILAARIEEQRGSGLG
ncbi:MAG: hypothetical protein COX57_01870 [Alphaproteobacteria bacterium CG_4_10_14_0_2_um_filter_63_37]|nr:MAG: hypothetical protein AUJ55_10895 [Proteobacteria bacterium CG1_02_64_396]PJA25755.1 MAG: hypothetical protein COX57_01870 [Alphaproteobacteria bacterium CG_4_10_14_0_2_um_filter_63_37]